ncbi:MAG: hypothetical protein V3W14_06615 [Candidatus Neomarinimicrobiota bacterium]
MDERSRQYLEALARAGREKDANRDSHLTTAVEHFCRVMLMEIQASKQFDTDPQVLNFADDLTRFSSNEDFI